MTKAKPIDLARERGIRKGAQLLARIGIPNADALSREMQEDLERYLAERPELRRKYERQSATDPAEGEAEGAC